MSRPSLLQELIHAIIVTLVTLAILAFGDTLFWRVTVDSFFVLPIVLTYTFLLYRNTEHQHGLITLFSLHALLTFLSFIFPWQDDWFCIAMLFITWMTRLALFQKQVVHKLFDAGVVVIGCIWSHWVYTESSSIYLSIWCFFLSQCLWVLIPSTDLKTDLGTNQNFDQAYQQAERALQKLGV